MAVAIGGFAGCKDNTAEKVEDIRPVKAVQIASAGFYSSGHLPGRAEAARVVNLAFEVSGVAVDIPVAKGDRVKAEQVLARLDPRDYQNALDAAMAARNRAQVQYERLLQASKTGAVSQQDVTDAKSALDIAVADVEIKQKALEDTVIKAPFNGIVTATFAEKFERVFPKQPILRLVDDSEIEFTVQLPERALPYLPYAKLFLVTMDVYKESPLVATIKEFGAEASQTTRTYPLTLTFAQPEGFKILPGMTGYATAQLDLEQTILRHSSLPLPGLTVPPSALFEHNGKSCIWVVNTENSTVSRAVVSPVEVSSTGIRLSLNDLKGAEWVVVAGVQFLSEGQQVRLPK